MCEIIFRIIEFPKNLLIHGPFLYFQNFFYKFLRAHTFISYLDTLPSDLFLLLQPYIDKNLNDEFIQITELLKNLCLPINKTKNCEKNDDLLLF